MSQANENTPRPTVDGVPVEKRGVVSEVIVPVVVSTSGGAAAGAASAAVSHLLKKDK
jgi:hypothetical protein